MIKMLCCLYNPTYYLIAEYTLHPLVTLQLTVALASIIYGSFKPQLFIFIPFEDAFNRSACNSINSIAYTFVLDQ